MPDCLADIGTRKMKFEQVEIGQHILKLGDDALQFRYGVGP